MRRQKLSSDFAPIETWVLQELIRDKLDKLQRKGVVALVTQVRSLETKRYADTEVAKGAGQLLMALLWCMKVEPLSCC